MVAAMKAKETVRLASLRAIKAAIMLAKTAEGATGENGCILSLCLFNLHAEYIMRNAGLEEAQAGIKIAGRISITSDIQMTPPLWQKVKRN